MSKTILFNFTDECGLYHKAPNNKTLKEHPFYVRSNFIIEIEKYFDLENKINDIKQKYDVPYNVEIKWAHLGSALNKRSGIPNDLTADEIRSYITEVIQYICNNTSAKVYYTFTDNNAIGRVDEIKLLRMHLQNAFQRAEKEAENNNGYAIVIADDMNKQNKLLKEAIFRLTSEGDRFTQYPHVQKGFLVDFSDISCGLQVADLLAGIFTAALKRESASKGEKHKFNFGYNLFEKYIYKIIRHNDYHVPYYEVYLHGIKEIPSDNGKAIAESVSQIMEDKLYNKLIASLRE